MKSTKINPNLKTNEKEFHQKKMEEKSDTAQSSPSVNYETKVKPLEIEGLIKQKTEIEKWSKIIFPVSVIF